MRLTLAVVVAISPVSLQAQYPAGEHYSKNIEVLSHVPLGRMFTVADIEAEQELSRPYVYVPRMQGITHSTGFSIVSVKDPRHAKLLYTWTIENPELLRAYGGLQGKYFKLKGRYYYAQSLQILRGSPNADVGAVIMDVTGLPDTSTIREVGRIRTPQNVGGFHNLFTYKHSDGRVLLFSTSTGPFAGIYDMEKFLGGAADQGFIAPIPIPNVNAGVAAAAGEARPSTLNTSGTYHDFYVGFDPRTQQDKFYGAGWSSGYFIFDVTRPEEPKLITSITGVAGGASEHTFTPTPDGRYAVAEMEYRHAPLRIFDLQPGLDGTAKTISRPIGAWNANWKNLAHNHEVRWPYVFVSGYKEGLQVFNMMDPTNPYTVAFYDTYDGPDNRAWGGADNPESGQGNNANGSFGIEVRNADGLIFTSDMTTGLWVLKMDGFDGWNGHQWGMPNISSAQDWDNGPDGAAKPSKVS